MEYNISKSRYCSAVQCPKILWLKKNMPDVFDSSVVNQAVLDAGSAVGDLAMGLFGDFVEVPFGNLSNMVAKTKQLMDLQTPVIAEASFSTDGLFCSVDILKVLNDAEVELHEVKSSTSVHDIYYHDAAFQYYVLSKLGYKVRFCNIVHINNQYERNGELDIHELFTIKEVTADVIALQHEVEANIRMLREYMKQIEEPEDDIGEQCFSPYPCGFFAYCSRHLPTPNIFQVAGARTTTKLKCYRKGIVSFEDLNTCDLLSRAQYKQIEHELFHYPPYIDKELGNSCKQSRILCTSLILNLFSRQFHCMIILIRMSRSFFNTPCIILRARAGS